jgi:hypothetical protein
MSPLQRRMSPVQALWKRVCQVNLQLHNFQFLCDGSIRGLAHPSIRAAAKLFHQKIAGPFNSATRPIPKNEL